MLVAEAVCVARRETRQPVRAAAYLVSALANNLPDVDVLYAALLPPRPLGNLLHHRGYTHTLALALPGAWLLATLVFRGFARRYPEATPRDRRLLLGLALGGVVLHLCMDFGNNYGVHPFWPLSSRWFYGDALFIIEPLWWAIAIPIVASRLERRWLRLLLWSLLGAMLVACWFLPFVANSSRLALVGLTGLASLLAFKASPGQRIGVALAACLAIPVVFALASARAKAELRAASQAAFPALEVVDIAATPMPANPTCWEGLVAGEQGGRYRVIRASVALPPTAAKDCVAGRDVEPTAPVMPVSRADHEGVRWLTEYGADVKALRLLKRTDCRFRALLEFARLPYVSASGKVAGDLRYDRQRELDFSDIPLTGACPGWVPGWREPRADVLSN
jgi:inner membrane protein